MQLRILPQRGCVPKPELETLSAPERSAEVLRDFQQFPGDAGQPADPVLTRTLREQLRRARCSSRVAVILGCRLQLPPELDKEFTVLHLGLPGMPDLRLIATGIGHLPAGRPAGAVPSR